MPENQQSARSLYGIRLWLARLAYLLVLTGIIVIFFIGMPKYIAASSQGGASLSVERTAQGDMMITRTEDEVAQAGIGPGDILLGVDNQLITAETSMDDLDTMLTGKIGESLTLSILTQNGSRLDVTIVRGRALLNALSAIGISLSQLILFHIILTGILMLTFALISFLIFIRRSDDWFVILVALTQMLLPLTLRVAPQLTYGALALNAFWILNIVRILSLYPLVAMIYLFPKGVASKWVGLLIFLAGVLALSNVANYLLNFFTPLLSVLIGYAIWWFFLIIGVLLQVHRYRKIYSPTERQQTKWVIIGFAITLIVFFLFELSKNITGLSVTQTLLLGMASDLALGLTLIFLALIMAFAVFHYKLWDADFYINRTVIYGLVTGVLALFWGAMMALLNYAFQQFTDKQSPILAAVLSSVQVIALFQPVRGRIETWINSHFYKDRVDFTKAIVELQPEKWQFIAPQNMYDALAESVTSLLQSDKAAVYTFDGNTVRLGSAVGIKPALARQIKLDDATRQRLQAGKVVQLKDQTIFAVIVPLTVPRGRLNDLIGILAVGPRAEERGYSRDHISDLSGLGQSAGTAIHFLQLNQKKSSHSA
ncbi:MAG: hypothetical protein HYX49_09375 [Chloroflexi bacterium]|nr:hypothetical protein [Chloroflexota bacterium]